MDNMQSATPPVMSRSSTVVPLSGKSRDLTPRITSLSSHTRPERLNLAKNKSRTLAWKDVDMSGKLKSNSENKENKGNVCVGQEDVEETTGQDEEMRVKMHMRDSLSNNDELTIPRAAMNKMIKELLPNIRVANEARELVLNCCTEFIHLISSESNDICNQQQKKTISAEHVLVALEKLGYGDFRKDAEEVLTECKETAAKRRRQCTRLENLGIPEEELLRQQQELFAKAREAAALQERQQGEEQNSGGGGDGNVGEGQGQDSGSEEETEY